MKVCTFLGCDRRQKSKRLCQVHYDQHRRGRNLTPIQLRRSPAQAEANRIVEMESGSRLCSGCRRDLPLPEFHKKLDWYAAHCRSCKSELLKVSKYGLTREGWEAIFSRQGRVCRVCGTGQPGARDWVTDHNHLCCPGESTCGLCVRGILCNRCNLGLGHLEGHLEQAVEYLNSPLHWLTLAEEDQAAAFYGWQS